MGGRRLWLGKQLFATLTDSHTDMCLWLDLTWYCVSCRALNDTESLRELRVEYCGIKHHGCLALSKAAGGSVRLSKLDLSSNCIESVGATALADMLTVSSSLTVLELRETDMPIGIGACGAIAICTAAQKSISLRELNLECKEFHHTAFRLQWRVAKALSSALRLSSNLTKLNLAGVFVQVRSCVVSAGICLCSSSCFNICV